MQFPTTPAGRLSLASNTGHRFWLHAFVLAMALTSTAATLLQ